MEGPERRKVLVILPSYDSGGAENYALRLIRHAGNAEIEWHVTTGNLRNAQLEPIFQAAGARTHHASTGYLNPVKLYQFSTFARSNGFDAIVNLNGVFSAPSMFISALLKIPNRVTWHRCSKPAHKPSVSRAIYQALSLWIINACSTRILSNSQSAFDYYHPRHFTKTNQYKLISNGFITSEFRNVSQIEKAQLKEYLKIPEETKIIGHVGRFTHAKNHRFLFEITCRLKETVGNICLIVAGTGTNTEEFKALAREFGLADTLYCLGVRSDIAGVYPLFDLFVFPSLTEGQPNALIEAILSGVPVTASAIPPNLEATPQFIHQNFFKLNDQMGALVIAKRLLQHPKTAKTEDARAWAAMQFDAEQNFNCALSEILAN